MSINKEKTLKTRNKPAALGPDLNLETFERSSEPWPLCPITSLPEDVVKQSLAVGVRTDETGRAGTYFQIDHSVVFYGVKEMFEGKVEIMSTREAMEKYEWFEDYWWKLVASNSDKYTATAELKWDLGYFIRILEGEKVTLPLQSCIFISKNNLNQNVHNIIIAEPNSNAQIITGCTIHPNVNRGLHVGISEFYVKNGAHLTFTMIHYWTQDFHARPRTAALVEDDATFVNNYVCLKPVKSLQTYPVAYCKGSNSRVSFNSIIYGSKKAHIDIGAKIVLQNAESRGEVVTRAIAADEAKIYTRGLLVGEHVGSRGRLECRGLLLSDRALIHAIPELIGKVKGTDLYHEAAVGKIAEDQIQYLMARGFSESEAESLIIRGFMNTDIFGLPENLNKEIKTMIESTTRNAL